MSGCELPVIINSGSGNQGLTASLPVITIVNSLAINLGMICDGAKPSCAAKIASAIEAGLLGMQMQNHKRQFYSGEGIILKGLENTIRNVSNLASNGMKETDKVIIDMMTSGNC